VIDLLLSGGTVVTMDPERRVLENGAVAIEGSRIAAVGPAEELARSHPAARTIDCRGRALIPGLVERAGLEGHLTSPGWGQLRLSFDEPVRLPG
jgi:predicted amidohydrolase YtcJ